jgi:hypothetical protein
MLYDDEIGLKIGLSQISLDHCKIMKMWFLGILMQLDLGNMY